MNNYSNYKNISAVFQSQPPLKAAVSREVLKCVLLVTLFILTLVSSLLPFALQRAALRSRTTKRRHLFVAIFSHLSCFGGGVFLATCLLDLLPDSRDVLVTAFEKLNIPRSDFPLAEFLTAFGFFMVLFSEQIFLWCKEYRIINSSGNNVEEVAEDNNKQEEEETEGENRSLLGEEEREHSHSPSSAHPHPHQPQPQHRLVGYLGSIQNQPTVGAQLVRRTVSSPAAPGSRNYGSILERSIEEPIPEEESTTNIVEETSAPKDVHFDPESHSTSRIVLLLVALSLHSTFEGLALGLQQDVSVAVQIFGALAIHKSILAFSLGLRLVQSKLSTLGVVLCCLGFSLTACVGGLIGVAIVEVVKSSSAYLVNGTLQGIACGTFLYVTAFEILPHELNDGQYRLGKLIMLTFGFSTICLFLLLWPDES